MPAAYATFEARGETLRFKFGTGAICALEEKFDQPFVQLLIRFFPELAIDGRVDPERLAAAKLSVRLGDVRAVLLAGLQTYQPEITTAIVDDIIDELGQDALAGIIQGAARNNLGGGGEAEADPR